MTMTNYPPKNCLDHPSRMWEWDGYTWVCAGCVMHYEKETKVATFYQLRSPDGDLLGSYATKSTAEVMLELHISKFTIRRYTLLNSDNLFYSRARLVWENLIDY